MTVSEIRQKYLEFFKAQGHTVIPSAPLVPENDPTTLFTSSGMQPLIPYLLGAPHPQGARLVDSQKSFRAGDIEEVGDNRHTTFFEMLGNWSLGDYFKHEQLPWFFTFLTDVVGLDPNKLYVTVFMGDDVLSIPKDEESIHIWKELFRSKGIEAKDITIGSEANGYVVGMQGARIFAYDAKKNWWSRSGTPDKMPAGEPGGPDSEVFYDFGTPHDPKWGAACHPNCDCGRFMEIGNSVFMQYIKQSDGSFGLLPKANVDFGGGLERIAAAANNNPDVFLIDSVQPLIIELAAASGKNYNDPTFQKSFRIVADHLRAAVFMLADRVVPSNTDRGYITRRLLRRAVRHMQKLGIGKGLLTTVATRVIDHYGAAYPELVAGKDFIVLQLLTEEDRFLETLTQGMKEFEKGTDPFILFTTFGFPVELTEELAAERGQKIDLEKFKQEMQKHQDLSRAGSEQKFKGGLADTSEKTTMLHTSTHLMLAALRKYLGDHVHQAGSNITAERTRFDFTYPDKVPRDVLDKVEAYVNEAISKKANVEIVQMPKDEAKAAGVEGSFWEKYPDTVNVYQVKAGDGTIYSKELCGGPHVENTGNIAGTFKIVKEEASSAGVRRIKAVLE